MQPGDRLVCAFIQPIEVGQEFTSWPLHVTIVPWFRTDASSGELAKMLSVRLSDIEPFEVLMGDDAHLGHQKGKVVSLVQEPAPFLQIEKIVRETLKQQNAWIVDETTKVQRQYRPHVTAQRDAKLKTGDKFICDRIYIVEQNGVYKEVVGEVKLAS